MTALEEIREHIRAAWNELDQADALCTSEFCKQHTNLAICINVSLDDLGGLLEGAKEEGE